MSHWKINAVEVFQPKYIEKIKIAKLILIIFKSNQILKFYSLKMQRYAEKIKI